MTPTVLVTGAGGPAGVAVIRQLRSVGHTVVGVDADPWAVGARLADVGDVVPRADADGYIEALVDVAKRTGAAVLISTVAEEMAALSAGASTLAAAGLDMWLPDAAAVRRCIDKWEFAQVVTAAGLPTPMTSVDGGLDVEGPWVVKPRFGRGSRNVFLLDRRADVEWACRHVDDALVQTRIGGREFTVDALVDRDGVLAGAVPRWRLETKAGISTKGETFRDDDLVALVGRVLDAVGMRGPANVQGFRTDADELWIIEVNPRFSGGLPLSQAAGADLVGEYVRAIQGHAVRRERLEFEAGVRMMRHFDEVYER